MAGLTVWLDELGLGQYAGLFADNDIDREVLPTLSEDDLSGLGLSLGHRRKLLKAIAELDDEGDVTVLERPPAAAAERRQVTVMFCDLVGSTALSRKLDPEDLRTLMAAYQGACAGAIRRFDGHVAKYLGDGVLAYFGYPQAHEDDAQRAVRAGLVLVEAIAALDSGQLVDVKVRVGIHTGLVVAGEIGEARDEIVGETPNVAARLQEVAEPGTVVIGPLTHDLLHGHFACEASGPRP